MTRPEARCPITPQCSFLDGSTQCGARASHLLVDPDGDAGGYYCKRHGQRLVDSYAHEDGEKWTLEPLVIGAQVEESER